MLEAANVIIQAGAVYFYNSQIFNPQISGTNTEVYFSQCDIIIPVITSGSVLFSESIITSTGVGNSITANGGYTFLKNCISMTPTQTPAPVAFNAGSAYTYADSGFDVGNSTFAGTAIIRPGQFQSINVMGGNITTNSLVSAAGNVTGGNISTAGNITGNTNGFAIGYLNIPQVAASNTTIGLTDAGKHYYSTTAGNLTLTIPTNANVAFATGTAISIVVQAAGNILVNAASGVTLYMAGNSTAANRVVGGYGMATLMKVASDTWFINGAGVA
jgi:hypothetical protein